MNKPITKQTKAALYIRVSTDAQAEEGYSIDAQKEMLIAFCKTKRIDSYELYIDGGFTGSNIERPEMQRLVEDVKKGLYNIVIVYKLDRLSRSQKDTLYLIEDVFNLHNVEFVSLNENLDTSTPMGRAMLGIMSAFAQLEREQIRERTRMGMLERVKTGLWMGGGRIPFGYDYSKEKGILVKNNDSATVVKIYDLYLQGYSMQSIANIVGLKYDRLVMQIILRKTNYGVIEYNGQIYPGQHEPLITKETYDKTIEMVNARAKRQTTQSNHLLTGLIVCGKCGAKIRYQKWNKNGDCKLVCYSQQKSKRYLIKDPDCNNKKVWAKEIEEIVIKTLLDMSWQGMINNEPSEIKASPLELLFEQQKQLSNKLKRLYNLYGDNGDDELLETIELIKKDLKKINEQITDENEKGKLTTKLAQTQNLLQDLSTTWEYMTIREKKSVLNNIIDKIVLTDNNVEVYYNL